VSLYGITEGQLQEIRDAQQAAIRAAEQQYEQPNWFKVAAGFAKPQLGGFLASLGSASEALGENVEKQRAMQLPIAQMRSQLAQTNVLLGQNKSIADEIAAWRKAHPGQMPPADLVMEWRAKAPSSPTVSSIAEQQKLGLEQQQQAIQVAGRLLDAKAITNEQYADMLKRLGVATQLHGQVQPSAKTAPSAPSTAAPAQVGPQPYTTETGTEVTSVRQPGVETKNEPPSRLEVTPLEFESKPSPTVKFNIKDMPVQKQIEGLTAAMNAATNPFEQDAIRKEIDRLKESVKPQEEATVKPEKPQGYYPVSVPRIDFKDLTQAETESAVKRYEAQIAATENPHMERIANLTSLMTGPNYTTSDQSYDSAIKMIEDNPQRAKDVFALVRKGGPILAALNEGFGVHAGNFNANVSLPVEAFLKAGLSEKDKEYADKLFSHLNNIVITRLAQSGISMGKVPQQEYMKAMSGFVNSNMTEKAALNMLHHYRTEFDHNKEYFDQIRKEVSEQRHHPNSRTPYSDIEANSPYIRNIHNKYKGIHNYWDRMYNLSLGGK
jgi:hypothetical protein